MTLLTFWIMKFKLCTDLLVEFSCNDFFFFLCKMSRKQAYTDDQLRIILEESDYEEEIQSNSSESVENYNMMTTVWRTPIFPK